jgi:hypothetical protein
MTLFQRPFLNPILLLEVYILYHQQICTTHYKLINANIVMNQGWDQTNLYYRLPLLLKRSVN